MTASVATKPPLDLAALLPEIDRIADPALRANTEAVWQRLWQESAFTDIASLPVTPECPYPHMPHNRSVLRMAMAVAEILEAAHGTRIDRDRLIAAAALQDACKLVEYEPGPDGKARRSEIGRRFPHGFYGAHVAVELGLPADVTEAILAHTFEAPGFPPNLLCRILFYVDQIDMAAIGGDRWQKRTVMFR